MSAGIPGGLRDRRSATPAQIVRALRPTHWPRNLLVFGPSLAAGQMLVGPLGARELLMAVSLVAMASAGYLINDVHDREEDRMHPRKVLRPIAAGTLSVQRALLMAVGLAAAALLLAAPLGLEAVGVSLLYGSTTLSYTLVFRAIPVLDVVVIMVCYLLRTAAGAVVAGLSLGSPFVIVTTAVALYATLGKRYSKLVRVAHDGRSSLGPRRPVLMLTVGGCSALVAAASYAGWSLDQVEGPWGAVVFLAGVVAFVLVLARYGRFVWVGRAESPEAVVRRDVPLQALLIVWACLVGVGTVFL